MALDGAMLSQIAYEIQEVLLGARVDKIYQPSREEIAVAFRAHGQTVRLLLCAGADTARVHFTQMAMENPKAPPMFCMLMRKHLGSAKLIGVEQVGMDRILHLKFSAVNEMGDEVVLTLAIEIMGRHSNIILIGNDGRVIDAVKRIDLTMSSVRQVLPGMVYELPPRPEKRILPECTAPQVVEAVLDTQKEILLSKRLLEVLEGFSPLVCREMAYFAGQGEDLRVQQLGQEQLSRLEFYLAALIRQLREHTGVPTLLVEPSGRPKDFTFIEVRQYGSALQSRTYPTYSQLLDAFYGNRDTLERMCQRSGDLVRTLSNISERIARKLASQREELKECKNRETLKIYGELLSANLYAIQKGDREAVVENYYEEGMPKVAIPLDPMLTPVQNSQKYYTEYRKADTAEKKLVELIAQGEQEALYIDAVIDSLARARTEAELDAIRRELADGGYLRHQKGKAKKEEKLPPLRYRSSDGFTILCGRNNVQNDRLTLKESRNYDVWFHTQKIPGSHTVVVSDGREVPNSTLEEAAVIAAYNSKARDSTRVPVDYTYIKNVKKPNGAKPGMVIYETYETAIVTPDEELVQRLAEK